MSAAGVLRHAWDSCDAVHAQRDIKRKGLEVIHALGREGAWMSPPQEEMGDCVQPAVAPLLSLTPPHLIDTLRVLVPLSYHTRYLLESTDTIIVLTLQMSFISSRFPHEAFKILHELMYTRVPCSLQARDSRQTLASTIHPNPLQQRFPHLGTLLQPGLFFFFLGMHPI